MGLLSGVLGLFGANKERKAQAKADHINRTRQLNDQKYFFQRTREAAELGGFNPLTALGTATMQQPVQTIAPLSSVRAMTQSLQDASKVLTGEWQRDQAMEDLRHDLLKIEIERERTGTPFNKPAKGPGKKRGTEKDTERTIGSPAEPEIGRETVTSTSDDGWVDPRSVDAQTTEERRGQIGGEIQGALNAWFDTVYNQRLQGYRKNYGMPMAKLFHKIYADKRFRHLTANQIEKIVLERLSKEPLEELPFTGELDPLRIEIN